jgi:uracil-DNA glycosylase family 4|tara:strand:- start:3974 stop:6535 length:2562 start_codon:yes stop_codon:yes gene_type:complete
MSFFGSEAVQKAPPKGEAKKVNVDTLRRMECKVCPLNRAKVKSPKMPPKGSKKAEIYVLGNAPDMLDDRAGGPFKGAYGDRFKAALPSEYHKKVRYNNLIRTMPPGLEGPSFYALNCCAPSIERDIAKVAPKVIIGVGAGPLKWATGFSDMSLWRGRKIAVSIGGHAAWFFPVMDPTEIERAHKDQEDCQRVFERDVARACSAVSNTLPPEIDSPKERRKGIICIDGMRGELDVKRVKKLFSYFMKRKRVGVDYETNGLRPYRTGSKILSVALSDGRKTMSLALDHKQNRWTPNQLSTIKGMFKKFLLKHPHSKIAHNLVFEHEWSLFFFGAECIRPFPGSWDDTMAQAFVIDERSGKKGNSCLSLDSLINLWFGFNLKSEVPMNLKAMDDEPLDRVLIYMGLDAKYTQKLFIKQKTVIQIEKLKAIYNIHVRRVATMALSQWQGVDVDQVAVKRHQRVLGKKLEDTLAKIAAHPTTKLYEKSYGEFNPASPDQVVKYFRDVVKSKALKTINKKTGKDSWSTKEENLAKVTHPVAEMVLDFRGLQKLKGTYVDLFDAKDGHAIYPDGKTHTNFNSLFVVTGRLSSDEPNHQNWPNRSEGASVREQLVPPPGHVFACFDYGQIEARVIGMASKDKVFCTALWNDYDVHQEWSGHIKKKISSWMSDADDKARRQESKNKFVFPLFFGAHPFSVAGYLGLDPKKLMPVVDHFWDVFKDVKTWQEESYAYYKEHDYIEGLTGRRRRGIVSYNEVINTPIQGVASDIVINAMDRLSEHAQKTGEWKFQARINIHDDLTFCLPKKTLDDDVEVILDHMLNVPYNFINVPISVELSIAEDNFFNKVDIGIYKSEDYPRNF